MDELIKQSHYHQIEKGISSEVFTYECDYCGQRKIVVIRIADNRETGYEARTHYSGIVFITGGKTTDEKFLCDRCLNTRTLVEDVMKLEERKKDLENIISLIKNHYKEIELV